MAERASSSSLINYIDFDKICRTCLKESDNLKSLFLNYGANDGCNYGVMVAECTKLQFAQNDGLPETICRVCIKDVKSAFAFKQKVEKSELALRTFYEQVKGKHAFEPSIKEEVGDDVNIKDEINVNDVKVDGQNDDDAFNNDDLHFNDNDDFSEDDVKPLNDYNNSLKKHVPQQEERSTETCATVSVSINQRDLLCASSSSIQKIPALSANLEIVSTKDRQLAEHAVSLLENACSDTIMFPRIENIYSLANDSSHPDRQQNVVAEILQTTPIGKALMQNYGKSGILDQAGRKRLCHLLVDFELKDDHDKILSPDRLTTLSQDITGIFKNEHSVTYYVPYISVGPGLKRLAKGKLLDCLNNRRKTLRAAGLIPSRKRPSGGASGSSSQELKMAREDDTDGAITWLRNRTDPWRFVEYYWNRTVKIRSRELLETKLTIAQYLELYPALKKPDGYLLLQHDFAAVYPAAVNKLYETFPIYKKKIYSLARMKLRQIIEVGVEKQRLTDILACEEGSTYSCALCDSSFSRASLLKRHKCSAREDMAVDENGKENLEDSQSEESFVCLSCNKKFEDIFRLQEHMKTHLKAPKKRGRPSKRDLKAKLQLESVLDKADLEDLDLDLDQDYVPYSSKMKTRECSKEYFCGVCDKVFITRSYFQTHMKTHTDRKSSECKICERSYIRVFLLKKHLLSHNTAEGLTSINFKAKLKLFENHEKYSDLDPIAETNQRLCEIIAEDIREGRLQRYMTTGADEAGDGGNYTCETCGVKFPYEMALNKHILRSHRGQNVSVKFLDPDYQKREKKFHCQNCNKSFYRAAHLAKHARTHVASERKFECSLCKKKFNRKDNLRSHMRVHDPNKEDLESNCLCVYCGRSFSNSSNLIVHMRRHTGEKPYQCDICEKGFPRSSDLLCHRRTHTGEKPCLCTICGKGFSRSNKLVRHMRIHTGQRPYKCTFCDKAFTQSNDLTLHIRRHTGDKPYVCNICGDRFIQGTALQTHRRLLNHHEPPQPPQPPVNSVNNPHRPPHWNKAMKTTKSTQNNVSNDGGSTADVKPADIKPAANLTPGEGNNNESATQPAFISTPDVVAIANHTLFSISQYTQNFN